MKALDFVNSVADALSWGQVETIETDRTPETRKIIRSADLVLRSLQSDKAWDSLATEGKLMVQYSQEDISRAVTIERGATSITFSAPVGMEDGSWYNGCLLQIGDYPEIFRIVEYQGSHVYTLDKPWVEANLSASTQAVTFGRDIYQMPADYDRLTCSTLKNIHTGNEVTLVDSNTLRQEWITSGTSLTPAEPTKFTIEGSTSKNNKVIRFNRIPDAAYTFEYTYQREHPKLETDTTEILYPSRMHLAIIDTIAARLYRDVEDSAKYGQLAQEALNMRVRGEANPDPSDNRMQMSPDLGRTRAHRRK